LSLLFVQLPFFALLLRDNRIVYQQSCGFTNSNSFISKYLLAFAICDKTISFVFNNLLASFVTFCFDEIAS